MKVFHLTLLLSWCQLHCVLGSSVQCGRRFTEFSSSSSGIVGGREQDPGQLAAPTQAFPWLVKVEIPLRLFNVNSDFWILDERLLMQNHH